MKKFLATELKKGMIVYDDDDIIHPLTTKLRFVRYDASDDTAYFKYIGGDDSYLDFHGHIIFSGYNKFYQP